MATDRELLAMVKQIREGSIEAFERFYATYVGLVRHIAYQMLQHPSDVEDVCQDVFIEVLEKIDQYDSRRGSMEAWLAMRAKSRCLDRLRKQQRMRTAFCGLEDIRYHENAANRAAHGLEEMIADRWEMDTVRQAVEKIPELQRQALYGVYIYGHSHRELAEKMNKPLGTVKSLIRYGLQNVRRQLVSQQGAGWEFSGGGANE